MVIKEKKFNIYKKIFEAFKTPKLDIDVYKSIGISITSFRTFRHELELMGVVAVDSEVRNINGHYSYFYKSTVTSIDDLFQVIPTQKESDAEIKFKTEDEKAKSGIRGAMRDVKDLARKLREQNKQIHLDRQNRYHRQGAISSGGVEFV